MNPLCSRLTLLDNFTTKPGSLFSVNDGNFYSSFDQCKIPYVSAADIGAVAFHALTDATLGESVYNVSGPELLTVDQVAEKMSTQLSTEIIHVNLTAEERRTQLVSYGVPDGVAQFLVWLEQNAASGVEEKLFHERPNDAVFKTTGRMPMTFDAFLQR